jgi:protein involved in polysaccharide export with SLBB domain
LPKRSAKSVSARTTAHNPRFASWNSPDGLQVSIRRLWGCIVPEAFNAFSETMLESHHEFRVGRTAIYVRKFLRSSSLLLLTLAALLSLSFAQDSASQDSTYTTRPSQADCVAAANSGRTLPAGCQQDESSASQMRQQPETVSVQPPQLTPGRAESPEQFTLVPLNPSQRKRVEPPLRPQTEFEQVVADTVGRTLPLFGQSLFAQPPSTFAPTDRTQVPADYAVGPDDELQIRIWGQVNADLRVVVDRSGQIYIPRVGPISVAGVRYSDLEQHLKAEVLKLFRNFNLTVSIGRIRSIQVYVVGQAHYPGTYTVSALSTLVNTVFASGGPTPMGSLRDVQVQREGKTIAHMDFYDLLVKGDKSKDVALKTGDVLYFPPIGPLAAIAGSVNAPAIYEVKPGSPLGELIEIAGGLSTEADANKVTVERFGDAEAHSVLEFPLDDQSRTLSLKDGDIVRVLSVVPRFGDAVTLRGNVVNPGRYPWKPGMRVRDLIPNAQALLTRPYWMSRDAMVDGRSTQYPIRNRPAGEEVNPVTPNSFVQGARDWMSPDLNNRDFASGEMSGRDSSGREMAGQQSGQAGQQSGQAELSGQSGQPARLQPWQSGDASTLRGWQNPNSETLTGDLHRTSPEINWSYAIVQRVNPVDLSTKLLSFDLGKAVLEGDPADNLELEPDDIVTIFSQSDVAVPQSLRTRYVRLEGEVLRAGVYKAEEGELLRDVIKRAGGVTPQAYIYGTELTRESARLEQQKSIDELARSLEVEMRQASVSAATRGNPEDAQAITARQAAQEAMIAQLRSVKATGRVVLNLKPSANSIDAYPPIAVEDNDRIVIPHLPSTVAVTGMVYNPGSFVFNSHNKVGDYLKFAGTGKPNSDMKHAFVLHADGTVVARLAVNGVFAGDRFADLHLHPGDQIVVPNKIQTGDFVRGLRDWTQITSQLALTGAALAVIH